MKVKLSLSVLAVFLSVSGTLSFAQTPHIVSTLPTQNELNVPVTTNISVTFDIDMDETTINDSTFMVNGRSTGLHQGAISYNSQTRTATFDPSSDFDAGEVVTVVLTQEIESSQGIPIGNSYVWSFTIVVNGGTGSFAPDSVYPVGDEPQSIFAADFDGDGDLDLITANFASDNVSVLLNNGDATFAPDSVYPVGDEPQSIFAADLDGDGDLDLITANSASDDVSVLLNNGDGTFVPDTVYHTGGDYAHSVFAADLDGDGDLDLTIANAGSDDVSVLLTSGPDSVYSTRPFGGKPYSVFAADLDGDGHLDIATANGASRNVSVFLNRADGTFAPCSVYSVAGDPEAVFSADLDHDGDLELVTANKNPNCVSVLVNNGNATFGPDSTYAVGNYPRSVFAADLDGDGDLDLIIANFASDNVSVLLNNGDATFAPHSVYPVGYGPRSVFAADLDGDGILDLATANSGSDDVSVTLQREADVGVSAILSPPDSIQIGLSYPLVSEVSNYGADPQTFDVIFEVYILDSPTIEVADTTTITAMPGGSLDTVTFTKTLLPTLDTTYNLMSYTALAGDEDSSNDTTWSYTYGYYVFQGDAGVSAIVSPPESTQIGLSYPLMSEVQNYGDDPQTFDVVFEVWLGSSPDLVDTVTLVDFGAHGMDTITFAEAWEPTLDTLYDLVSYTLLAGDENTSNDTTWSYTYGYYVFGSVSGAVTDQASDPVEWVYILALGTSIDDSTDASGEYLLDSLSPDTYDICFLHPAYRDTVVIGAVVTVGDTTYLNVVMEEIGAICGTVTDQLSRPIQGVQVLALATSISDFTDANGQYALPELSPGAYDVSFTNPHYADTTVAGITVTAGDTTLLPVVLREIAGPLTIYIDDDNTEGPWEGTFEHPFQYIQDGLNAARSRDTVYAFSGTYYECPDIAKSLTVRGESRTSTVIDGGGADVVLHCTADSVFVSDFTIRNAVGSLVFIDDSNLNTIIDNIITNCSGDWGRGIRIYDHNGGGDFNSIIGNTISNCSGFAVNLIGRHEGNRFVGNDIVDNYRGIYSYNTPGPNSPENQFNHNNFVNNDIQVLYYWEGFPADYWDNGYPSGGNYWDDYTGIDENEDGIGDTPYDLEFNNEDRYPLMAEWSGENTGTILGVVTDELLNPIDGLRVLAVNALTNDTTDVNGEYSLDLYLGIYDITFTRPPYYDTTVSDVRVLSGDTTILDVVLLYQWEVDVGISAILSLPDTINVGLSYALVTEVCNYGTAAQSFDVVFEASVLGSPSIDFVDTATVLGMSSNSIDTVTFYKRLAPTLDTMYEMVSYTVLSSDQNAGNDTAVAATRSIQTVDVGVHYFWNPETLQVAPGQDFNWTLRFESDSSLGNYRLSCLIVDDACLEGNPEDDTLMFDWAGSAREIFGLPMVSAHYIPGEDCWWVSAGSFGEACTDPGTWTAVTVNGQVASDAPPGVYEWQMPDTVEHVLRLRSCNGSWFSAPPIIGWLEVTDETIIYALHPGKGSNTGSVFVTVEGVYFSPDCVPKLVKVGTPSDTILGTNTTVSDDHHTLITSFDLSGREVGSSWDLVVVNPGFGAGTLVQAFLIVSPTELAAEDILWALGSSQARIRNFQTSVRAISRFNDELVDSIIHSRYFYKAPDKVKGITFSNEDTTEPTSIILNRGWLEYEIDPETEVACESNLLQEAQMTSPEFLGLNFYDPDSFLSHHDISVIEAQEHPDSLIFLLEALPKRPEWTYFQLDLCINYGIGLVAKSVVYSDVDTQVIALTEKMFSGGFWIGVKSTKTAIGTAGTAETDIELFNTEINTGIPDSVFDVPDARSMASAEESGPSSQLPPLPPAVLQTGWDDPDYYKPYPTLFLHGFGPGTPGDWSYTIDTILTSYFEPYYAANDWYLFCPDFSQPPGPGKNGSIDGASGWGEACSTQVDSMLSNFQGIPSQYRPEKLNIIAHCMGGLAARECITGYTGCAEKISKLITVGTPHSGSQFGFIGKGVVITEMLSSLGFLVPPISPTASKINRIPQAVTTTASALLEIDLEGDGVLDMTPGSPFLDTLYSRPQHEEEVGYYAIAGDYYPGSPTFPGSDDWAVTVDGQLGMGEEEDSFFQYLRGSAQIHLPHWGRETDEPTYHLLRFLDPQPEVEILYPQEGDTLADACTLHISLNNEYLPAHTELHIRMARVGDSPILDTTGYLFRPDTSWRATGPDTIKSGWYDTTFTLTRAQPGKYGILAEILNPAQFIAKDSVTITLGVDLSGEIFSSGPARRGFDQTYATQYANRGNARAEDVILQVNFPSETEYVSSSPPGSVIEDTVTWSFDSLDAGGEGEVSLVVYIPPEVPQNTIITTTSIISCSNEDVDLSNNSDTLEETVVGSWDPNDKLVAPVGFTESGYIKEEERLQYTVFFENVDSATAEAIYVTIVDTLDPNLDWETLIIGPLSHPETCTTYFDPITGVITWTCDSIMLPPNQNPPEGEGWVTYSIYPHYLPHGTEIENRASIQFDFNPWIMAPEESPVVNTIDEFPPSSRVHPLKDSLYTTEFTVLWRGTDDSLGYGSGIKSYDVYVSKDGSADSLWLANTTNTCAIFAGEAKHLYCFYSIARDSVGNVEEMPGAYDACTWIAAVPFMRGDADGDMRIQMTDAIFSLRYLYVPGSPSPPCLKAADTDDDGSIVMADPIYILKHLYVPGSPPPPFPYPDCGSENTPDELDCQSHPCMTGGKELQMKDSKRSGGELRLGPPEIHGSKAIVSVYLKNTVDLAGFAYTIEYDPSQVAAESVGGRDLITQQFDFFSAKPEEGKITVGNVVSLTMKKSLAIGEYHVADIVFNLKTQDLDKTELKLIDVELVDTEANALSCETVNATIDRWLHLRMPKIFALRQAFPNPFTGETSIRYQLPEASHVELKIYNSAGQLVRTLIDAEQKPGYYRVDWNGKDAAGTKVASGVYFYRIEMSDYTATKKMILLK